MDYVDVRIHNPDPDEDTVKKVMTAYNKYDALLASHKKLVKALERIHDQAHRTNLVQDRSVGLIKQCLLYMEKNAKQAISEAENV